MSAATLGGFALITSSDKKKGRTQADLLLAIEQARSSYLGHFPGASAPWIASMNPSTVEFFGIDGVVGDIKVIRDKDVPEWYVWLVEASS